MNLSKAPQAEAQARSRSDVLAVFCYNTYHITMFYGQHKDRSSLKLFSEAVLTEVQAMAQAGLTKEEILDGFSLSMDQIPEDDMNAFNEHFNYGRVIGLRQMGDNLFMQARSKQGTPAALAFLGRFAREWQKEVNENGDTTFNFTMKV